MRTYSSPALHRHFALAALVAALAAWGAPLAVGEETPVAVADPLSADNGKWTANEFQRYEGGAFRVKGDRLSWAYTYRDGLAQIDTEHVSGAQNLAYGFAVRLARRDGNDKGVSGYALWIAATGSWRLVKYLSADTKFLTDWQPSPALKTGDGVRNTVGVVCVGDQITAVVNGQAVGAIRDADFADGGVGPVSTSDQMEIAFRDLKIDPGYKLAAAAPPSPAPAPAATAPAAVSYVAVNDPLDHDNGKWVVNTLSKFDKAAYHLTGDCMNWAYSFRDGLAQVDSEHIAGPTNQAYGMGVRTARRGNDKFASGYAAWIGADKSWRLVKYDGTGNALFLTDWQVSEVLAAGDDAKNTIGLVCKGDQITLLLNGHRVFTVHDGSFADGGVALLTTLDKLEVAFRNLKIDPDYKFASAAQ